MLPFPPFPLRVQLQVLAKQNVALKRNISCLYKTAKAELDRKNEDIKVN